MNVVSLFSGTPRSGKGLHCANYMITELKHHKNIIANYDIDLGYFKKKKIGKFDYIEDLEFKKNGPKILWEYAKNNHKKKKEHQTTIIFDDCDKIFNSYYLTTKQREEWITFFQNHGKLGFDVILVAHNDRLIDRQIRSFIESEFKHRAIKHYKFFGFLLSLITGGLFVAVEYWYGAKLKIGSNYYRLNRKKARIYDTYKIFE